MSLKRFFRKKKQYEHVDDIKHMTPQEIRNLDLSSVGIKSITESDPHLRKLSIEQRRAFYNLAEQKKLMKEGADPEVLKRYNERKNRENKQIDEEIRNATSEIVKEDNETRDLEIRLKMLKGEPLTEEEELYMRFQKLKVGGKRKTKRKSKVRRCKRCRTCKRKNCKLHK